MQLDAVTHGISRYHSLHAYKRVEFESFIVTINRDLQISIRGPNGTAEQLSFACFKELSYITPNGTSTSDEFSRCSSYLCHWTWNSCPFIAVLEFIFSICIDFPLQHLKWIYKSNSDSFHGDNYNTWVIYLLWFHWCEWMHITQDHKWALSMGKKYQWYFQGLTKSELNS